MTNTDIEYLVRIVNTAFDAVQECPECDRDFTGEYGYFNADNENHITMRNSNGEWGIVIACEGYHMIR